MDNQIPRILRKIHNTKTDEYTDLRSNISIFSKKLHYTSYNMFTYNEKKILIKYGKFLNANLMRQPTLFYHVLCAITSNLPPGWTENKDDIGTLFYRDPVGNEYYRHPMDSFYKALIRNDIKSRNQSCFR